jgi:hypothetical protein
MGTAGLTLWKTFHSLITRWHFLVSSICMIWVFPLHFTSVWKNMEFSVIFLRNGVLILNWKENKAAGAICFEIMIPRKKNKELLREVPSKIYASNFIMEKNKNIFRFVNNSEYHHREMGLISLKKKIFTNNEKLLFFLKELRKRILL